MVKIFAPDGSAAIVMKRERVELPAAFMRTLAAFADVAGELNIGLHCSICKQDLGGENNSQAVNWTMECECRSFIGAANMARQRAH